MTTVIEPSSLNLRIAFADIPSPGDFRVSVTDQRRQAIILRSGDVVLSRSVQKRSGPVALRTWRGAFPLPKYEGSEQIVELMKTAAQAPSVKK